MQNQIHIRAIAFKEGEVWVVQGIEYDIVAHAKDPAALPDAFTRAVIENAFISEQLRGEPMKGIKPAPERFKEMFEQATAAIRAVKPRMSERLPLPEMDIRLLAVA